MMKRFHDIAAALFAILSFVALVDASGAAPAERFEVTSLKAVRPTLVNTLDAAQKRDAARARESFEAYDSAWNGIEFYVNTRSRPMYDLLEHQYQARITKAHEAEYPHVAANAIQVHVCHARFY